MMLHSNRTDVSLVHQVNKAALNLNRKPKLILPKSGKEDVLLVCCCFLFFYTKHFFSFLTTVITLIIS